MFGRKQPEPAAAPAIIAIEPVGEVIALDCSWCAAEQGTPTTESPDICAYHAALVMQQAQQRRAGRQARP